MKVLFFTGRNRANESGVSWKRWQITRRGTEVLSEWGPIGIQGRKPVFVFRQSKLRRFNTVAAAIAFVDEKIRAKLQKGYQVAPRRRPS